jgi:pyruvate,water dikinase
VPDRRAGPPVLTQAGGRLFVDMTSAVRSTLGRQVVPRIFDVMEARSATMIRSLFDDPRLSVVYGRGPGLRAIARIAVRCRIPLLLLRVVVTPGFARRHLAALRAGLTAGLDLPVDPAPADHLRLVERILTERLPVLPPSVIPVLLVAMGSFVLTGRLQPDADPALREAVLRSMPHNVTTEMDLRLWALACEIRRDPAAVAELTGTAPATLAARYRAGALAAGTQCGLAGFLAEYGMRAVAEIDLGVPRWSEDPTHLLGVLANYLRLSDQRLAPDTQFAQGAAAAEAAIDELVRQARRRGRLRAALVRLGLRRARQLTGYRESPKFLLVTALARARQHIGEVGRALTASGVLGSADEVFFLDFAEAERALAGSGEDWRALVAARRDDYERELRRRVLPRILLSDGTEPTLGGAARELPDGALAGTPASRGAVTGVARVVLEPTGAHLEPGEILVAPSTDPGWTPLFLTAGGLVMEMGGANSHGAMVAREYGIPAVVGVPDATHKIVTGERIIVDGAAGIVMIEKLAD